MIQFVRLQITFRYSFCSCVLFCDELIEFVYYKKSTMRKFSQNQKDTPQHDLYNFILNWKTKERDLNEITIE